MKNPVNSRGVGPIRIRVTQAEANSTAKTKGRMMRMRIAAQHEKEHNAAAGLKANSNQSSGCGVEPPAKALMPWCVAKDQRCDSAHALEPRVKRRLVHLRASRTASGGQQAARPKFSKSGLWLRLSASLRVTSWWPWGRGMVVEPSFPAPLGFSSACCASRQVLPIWVQSN